MPTFTKRHYEIAAAAINAAWRQQNLLPDADYRAGVSATASKLAEAFKADNPRFDIFKFVGACTRERI